MLAYAYFARAPARRLCGTSDGILSVRMETGADRPLQPVAQHLPVGAYIRFTLPTEQQRLSGANDISYLSTTYFALCRAPPFCVLGTAIGQGSHRRAPPHPPPTYTAHTPPPLNIRQHTDAGNIATRAAGTGGGRAGGRRLILFAYTISRRFTWLHHCRLPAPTWYAWAFAMARGRDGIHTTGGAAPLPTTTGYLAYAGLLHCVSTFTVRHPTLRMPCALPRILLCSHCYLPAAVPRAGLYQTDIAPRLIRYRVAHLSVHQRGMVS